MNWGEVFKYEDGRLLWKDTGCPAGTSFFGTGAKTKYVRIQYHYSRYYAHRIIWEMHYGPIKEGLYIDHKDGNGENNSLNNLQLVTSKGNAKNRKRLSNNTSGVCGVSWRKSLNKWKAYIKVEGRQQFLGYYENFEEAKEARYSAERSLGFSARHGNP